ncbi:hypothetical protein V1509DRAFT_622902 [Lipomyces kononenkoae]
MQQHRQHLEQSPNEQTQKQQGRQYVPSPSPSQRQRAIRPLPSSQKAPPSTLGPQVEASVDQSSAHRIVSLSPIPASKQTTRTSAQGMNHLTGTGLSDGMSMAELFTLKQFAEEQLRLHRARLLSEVNLTPREIEDAQSNVQTFPILINAIRIRQSELVQRGDASISEPDNTRVKEPSQFPRSSAQVPITTNRVGDVPSYIAMNARGQDKKEARKLKLPLLPTEENYTHMKLDHIAENVLIALGRHPTKEPLNQSFVPLGIAGYITKRMNLKRLPEKMDWDSYDPPGTFPQQLHGNADEDVNSGGVIETSGGPESVNHSVVDLADSPDVLDRRSDPEADKIIQSTSEGDRGEPMEGVEIAPSASNGIESIQDSEGIGYSRIDAPQPMETDSPTCARETAATQAAEPRSEQMTKADEEKALGTLCHQEGTYVPGSTASGKPSVCSSKNAHNVVSLVKSNFQELKESLPTSQAELPVVIDDDITTLRPLEGDQSSITLQRTNIRSTSKSPSVATPQQISSGVKEGVTATINLDNPIPHVPLVNKVASQPEEVDKVPSQFPILLPGPTRPTESSEPVRATSQADLSMPSTISTQSNSLHIHDNLALTDEHRPLQVTEFLSESRPGYRVYNCGWHCVRSGRQDICAQLHNIAALKAHVFKRHRGGLDVRGYQCLWDNCHDKNNEHMRFESVGDFDQHMLEKHIQPIEASFGPGPSVAEELKTWPETLARNTSSLLTPLAIPMGELRANARKKQLSRGTAANGRAKLPRQLKAAINSLKTYGAGWSPEVDGHADGEVPSRQDNQADDRANIPRGNLGLYYSYQP